MGMDCGVCGEAVTEKFGVATSVFRFRSGEGGTERGMERKRTRPCLKKKKNQISKEGHTHTEVAKQKQKKSQKLEQRQSGKMHGPALMHGSALVEL